MPSRVSTKPHVLILGAGLGGLTLAQALRKQNISFEIFERDEGLHSRFQGWAIALHAILDDLSASMPDDLPPVSVTSHLQPLDLEPGITMYNEHGGVRVKAEAGKDVNLVRANRSRLRDYLSANLNVNWGMHMTKIEEAADSVTLHFSDGTTATGDILVGADGVHSPVRHHLLGEKDQLNRLPIALIGGQVELNKEQYERQLELAHSAYIIRGSGSGSFTNVFVGLNSVSEDASTAKYYWMISWADPEAGKEEPPHWTHTTPREELHKYAVNIAQTKLPAGLNEIFLLTPPEGIMESPLVFRDMILKELPNRRVTLLGDAAHPMTPFRAEGGNNALQDSLNLARAIAKSEPETILANLKEYQDEMLERGSLAVWRSRQASTDEGQNSESAFSSWSKMNQASKQASKQVSA